MENAAKALLIAGGILIAIILIALFLNMYNKMASFQNTQEEKKEAEQLLAFNSEYEMYDKKILYGADIITLINKAVENNKEKNAVLNETNYINIKVQLVNSSFESSIDCKYLSTNNTVRLTGKKAQDKAKEFNINISDKKLEAGKTYSLGYWNMNNSEELTMDPEIINWFKAASNDSIEQKTLPGSEDSGIVIYYIKSALTNFKLAKFTCTGVSYDSKTGRIKEIGFKEYNK